HVGAGCKTWSIIYGHHRDREALSRARVDSAIGYATVVVQQDSYIGGARYGRRGCEGQGAVGTHDRLRREKRIVVVGYNKVERLAGFIGRTGANSSCETWNCLRSGILWHIKGFSDRHERSHEHGPRNGVASFVRTDPGEN